MEIKIQSTQFIKPSKPTPENLRNFKLSFLDQLAPSSYTKLILYYRAGHELTIKDRCSQLVNSLSRVLTLFYPLAGRITENGLEVDCSDQGVKYLEAQVGISLDSFLEQGPKINLIRQLVAAPDQVNTSLITVQINLFDCGALAIGMIASHKVTDACNLVRFINEWAVINRTDDINGVFSPSFDNLDSLFPPREILSSPEYSPINDPEGTIVTKRFLFNGVTISKLRSKTVSSNRKPSRVTLVASLIWKALISIDQVKSGSLRDCLLAPAMNFRGKLGTPISLSSFGNVWAPYSVRYVQNAMESKYVDLVSLIEDTTRNAIKQLLKASSEDICTQAMACYAEAVEELKQNKFCIFTSWCGFPLYEVDFGWGKPYWASEGGRSDEMVTLMDDKHGDGIEAWVSLKEKDMYLFEQDQDILAFTS